MATKKGEEIAVVRTSQKKTSKGIRKTIAVPIIASGRRVIGKAQHSNIRKSKPQKSPTTVDKKSTIKSPQPTISDADISNSNAIKRLFSTNRKPPSIKKSIKNVPTKGASSKPSADKSLLNFRHDVRINGFSSFLNVAEKATPKVKHVLLNECDLIMECRICRNLFRSLSNFISHKFNFCTNLFQPSAENGCSQFIQKTSNPLHEVSYRYFVDSTGSDPVETSSLEVSESKNNFETNKPEASAGGPIIAHDNRTQSELSLYKSICNLNEDKSEPVNAVNLKLQSVSGRQDCVMLQTKEDTSNSQFDNRGVENRDTAILGPDGNVICTGTAKGIEKIVRHLTAQIDLAQRKLANANQPHFQKMCHICKTVFNTENTFQQHRQDNSGCLKRLNTEHENKQRNHLQLSGRITSSNMGNDELECPNMSVNRKELMKQLFSKPIINKMSPSMPATIINSKSQRDSPLYHKTNNSVSVSNHQRSHKGGLQPEQVVFPCVKCSAQFTSTQEMSRHVATDCLNNVQTTDDKPPRIRIEVRNSYKKLENVASDTVKSGCHEQILPSYVDDIDINCNVAKMGFVKHFDQELKADGTLRDQATGSAHSTLLQSDNINRTSRVESNKSGPDSAIRSTKRKVEKDDDGVQVLAPKNKNHKYPQSNNLPIKQTANIRKRLKKNKNN